MYETNIGTRPRPFTHLKIDVLLMQVEILNHPAGVKPAVSQPTFHRQPSVSERERAELGQLQLDLRHRPCITAPDGRTGGDSLLNHTNRLLPLAHSEQEISVVQADIHLMNRPIQKGIISATIELCSQNQTRVTIKVHPLLIAHTDLSARLIRYKIIAVVLEPERSLYTDISTKNQI